MSDNNDTNRASRWHLWVYIIFTLLMVILLLLWLFWPHLMTTTKWYIPEPSPEATLPYEYWDKFGALFGALVPLTSILSFAAVATTAFIQENRFQKEYTQRETHENEKLLIEMIMALANTHRNMDAKFSAKNFISVSIQYIDSAKTLSPGQKLPIHKDLIDIIDAWEISYGQLECICNRLLNGSFMPDEQKSFFKQYISSAFNLDDALIFSSLNYFMNGKIITEALEGTDFIYDADKVLERWVSNYLYHKNTGSIAKDVAVVYVKRFLESLHADKKA